MTLEPIHQLMKIDVYDSINTHTFAYDSQWSGGYDSARGSRLEERNCNSTIDIDINGNKYEFSTLKSESAYCCDDVAYDFTYFRDTTRCIADTVNPSYEWGFATMMSGIFVFITFSWCSSLYIVWQHAQFNSTLVKSGYSMTPLRAAFAMTTAAKRKTGMGERQLLGGYERVLKNELYGGCGVDSTSVQYGLFVEDPGEGDHDRTYLSVRELRARRLRGLSEADLG